MATVRMIVLMPEEMPLNTGIRLKAKLRAMEIINELEPVKRGSYAGTVGYMDFAGNMDMCITLRTMFIDGDNAYIQAGAGIVYDSKAEFEYKEILQKAKAMFTVVEEVENDVAAFR